MAAPMTSGFIEVLQKRNRCNNRDGSEGFRKRRDILPDEIRSAAVPASVQCDADNLTRICNMISAHKSLMDGAH